MTIDFYYIPASAPCRTVLLTAKAIGVELNLKYLDLIKGEHLTEEFLKINPQHTIPTLVDNGFVLWESRAIATYLVEKYAKDDSLYPKDIKQRAVVDQRLYFDIGTLFVRLAEYYVSILVSRSFWRWKLRCRKLKKIEEAFNFLNTFLTGNDYVAGNHLTVADLSIVATVSTCESLGIDISKYPNVVKWYSQVKVTAPGYEEANAKNLATFKEYIDKIQKK